MAITCLTTPPPALSATELAEISTTTPATFEGIPPILRHKEEQVEFSIDPAFEGFVGGKGELWITEGLAFFFFCGLLGEGGRLGLRCGGVEAVNGARAYCGNYAKGGEGHWERVGWCRRESMSVRMHSPVCSTLAGASRLDYSCRYILQSRTKHPLLPSTVPSPSSLPQPQPASPSPTLT
jgi:hypothetical protein